jgi:hypothetical protein
MRATNTLAYCRTKTVDIVKKFIEEASEDGTLIQQI